MPYYPPGTYVPPDPPTPAGLGVLYGNGAPDGSLGHLGQTYIDRDTNSLWEKTAADTWTNRGQMAKQVTDLEAIFETPSGADRGAIIS